MVLGGQRQSESRLGARVGNLCDRRAERRGIAVLFTTTQSRIPRHQLYMSSCSAAGASWYLSSVQSHGSLFWQLPEEHAIDLLLPPQSRVIVLNLEHIKAIITAEEEITKTVDRISSGAGIGVFLVIMSTRILLQRCAFVDFWPSPYVDRFGEEDVEMLRGRPLFLNKEVRLSYVKIGRSSIPQNSHATDSIFVFLRFLFCSLYLSINWPCCSHSTMCLFHFPSRLVVLLSYHSSLPMTILSNAFFHSYIPLKLKNTLLNGLKSYQ